LDQPALFQQLQILDRRGEKGVFVIGETWIGDV
jgi:hypothetical protein